MAEGSKRRSTRQAITRKRSIYADPETDDDFELSSGNEAVVEAPTTKRLKASGRAQSTQTRDVKSELSVPKRSRSQASSRGRSKSKRNKILTRSKHPVLTWRRKQNKPTQKSTEMASVIESDGVIPAWQTLPYEILLQVFTFAASPESRTWLLHTARTVCRAFAEPALSAYYQSPNLPTSSHLYSLLDLLEIPKTQKLFDYNVKVRRLDLDARALASASSGKDPFDLALYVPQLPHLTELFVHSASDDPPYRSHKPPRWRYPVSLFEALNEHTRLLRSWRWNWLYISPADKDDPESLCDYLSNAHSGPAFQSLTHLGISNLPSAYRPSPRSDTAADKDSIEIRFAETIGSLSKLESLTFESCEIIPPVFFERLPRTLRRLKIVNCLDLTSDTLYAYLAKDGSCQLRELVLDHNASLDLAFLPTLKSTCPHLLTLTMDLHYYSTHHTINDAEALYAYLLGSDEQPTWPSTLRHLELVHLQKWDAEGAQNLFSSLIEFAKDLPDLRRLVLQAHINVSWRDRAAFRDQWIERLQRVFLRPWIDPDTSLQSLKAFQKSRKPLQESNEDDDLADGHYEGSRRFSHVQITPRKPSSKEESDSEPLSKRRSKRVKEAVSTAANEQDAPSSRQSGTESDAVSVTSNDGESSGGDWRTTPEKHIQGLCTVVDIRIDNQRPREEQYNESHFLDSEASGDEDWNEGNDTPDESYAW